MDATKKPARRTADNVRQKEADFQKIMLENGRLSGAPAADDFGDPLGQSEYCQFQPDADGRRSRRNHADHSSMRRLRPLVTRLLGLARISHSGL